MHGLGGDLSPSQATTIEYTSEIGVPLGLGPTGPPGSEVQDQNTNTTSLGGGTPPQDAEAKHIKHVWGPRGQNGVTHGPVHVPRRD